MNSQLSGLLAAAVAACAVSIITIPAARGATKTIVYSFQGYPADGNSPNGPLLSWGGKLYGVTYFGGSGGYCYGNGGCGIAYSLALDGGETMLHQFGLTPDDGARPTSGFVEAKGVLYGTTTSGSSASCSYISHGGCGTVFKMTATGAETVLYAFQWFSGLNGDDGAFPIGLTRLGNAFYGATGAGGGGDCTDETYYGCGTNFRIAFTGTEAIPYSFQGGANGSFPSSVLAQHDGILYGATAAGGDTGNGIIYSMTPGGVEKILYSFQGGIDGVNPVSLTYFDGALFGITSSGGANGFGTVFSITPTGAYKLLYSFAGGSDGATPTSLIDVGGKLYGTTKTGGSQNAGTVFRLTKAGVEKVIYTFQGGSDGVYPNALLNIQGTLYGTTGSGGAHNFGSVFKLSITE